jgi:hypothetical protein
MMTMILTTLLTVIPSVDFPDDCDDDNTVDVISPENSMEIPGVIGTHPGLNPGVDEELADEEPPELHEAPPEHHLENQGVDEAPNEAIQGHHHLENKGVDDDPDDEEEHLEPTLEQRMDTRYGIRSDRYNLRPRKTPSYLGRSSYPGSHGHAHVNATVDGASPATAQMSMKKGLMVFGSDGVDAIRSEIQQLHERSVMGPQLASETSREHKRAALAYLMFLKQK